MRASYRTSCQPLRLRDRVAACCGALLKLYTLMVSGPWAAGRRCIASSSPGAGFGVGRRQVRGISMLPRWKLKEGIHETL